MKLSTYIIGILVLAGCASLGYYELSSSTAPRLAVDPVVTDTSKIPLPVPVAPRPPPPAVALSTANRERLMMAPTGAGPSGGSPPPVKVIEGTKVDGVSVQTFNANMAFSMRDKANIDEDIKAQMLIDPRKDLEQLEKELTVSGNKFSKNIKITKIVKATLTAPDFDIKNITEEEQFITLDQPTEWLWILSPKASGTYQVNLSVTAIMNIGGRESKHHIKTFERNITVEITHKQIISKWWNENWKWVTSTIVIPLLIFLLKDRVLGLLKRKKKSQRS